MSDPKPQAEPSMDEILATVRRIIAEDEAGAPAPAANTAIVSSDVLELTEALEPGGNVRHIPAFGTALRSLGEPRVPPLSGGRIEPAAPRSAAAKAEAGPPGRIGPRADAGAGPAEREPRISADQTGRVGARSLDDVVGEMLPPILQRWLDENLPAIVEKAVARAAAEAVAARGQLKTKPE